MIALDTNVLVYAQTSRAFDPRHTQAKSLIRRLALHDSIIPFQVLGEFINVCLRKLGHAPVAAVDQVSDYLKTFECVPTIADDLIAATMLITRFNLSYFDALICSVAQRAGATILLSEDMHDGLAIDGLKIINPFATGNLAEIDALIGSAL